ncbi:MAG: hypothetical protein J0L82_13960 [Deltaproteobacteria bacterium]|nr:hypothetical protein [Deltaproteobacteria bacterium]
MSLTVGPIGPGLEYLRCSHQKVDCLENTDCKTAAGASAIAGGSTAVAMKKFREPKKFEKMNSKVLAEWPGGLQLGTFRTTSLVGEVQDVDKVVVYYQLSFDEKSTSAAKSTLHHQLMATLAAISKRVHHGHLNRAIHVPQGS